MEHSVFNKIYQLQKDGWWFGVARNRMVLTLLDKHGPFLNTHKILDIGSSEGAFLEYLKNRQLDFIGIDIDENAIRFCTERGLGEYIKYGSITDIPFPADSFEVVTGLDIIEHIDDDMKAMSEIFRVVKKNGVALIIVPAYKWLWSANDIAYHHKRRYTKKEFLQLVSKSGFRVKQYSYYNFFLFPVFVVATFYSKLFPSSVKTSTVLKPLPKIINYILKQIMYVEEWMIKQGIRLPFGSSMIFVLHNSK